jgi:hypothetical protein
MNELPSREEAEEALAEAGRIRMSMQQARLMAEHLGFNEPGGWQKISRAAVFASDNGVPQEHNPLLALARLGARVCWPDEETVERVFAALAWSNPDDSAQFLTWDADTRQRVMDGNPSLVSSLRAALSSLLK